MATRDAGPEESLGTPAAVVRQPRRAALAHLIRSTSVGTVAVASPPLGEDIDARVAHVR